MIKLRNFSEEWVDSRKYLSFSSGKSMELEVFKNPSTSEWKECFASSWGVQGRGILTKNGDLYCIAGEKNEIIHDDLFQVLKEMGILKSYGLSWIAGKFNKEVLAVSSFENNLYLLYLAESYIKGTVSEEEIEYYKKVLKRKNPNFQLRGYH